MPLHSSWWLLLPFVPHHFTRTPPLHSAVFTDPVPFHLVSLIPSTSNRYSFISLGTCLARVVFAMVLTFQQPMIICHLKGYYGAYRPLGFQRTLTQQRHCSASSNTPSQCCLLIHSSSFSMLSDQQCLSCVPAFLLPSSSTQLCFAFSRLPLVPRPLGAHPNAVKESFSPSLLSM